MVIWVKKLNVPEKFEARLQTDENASCTKDIYPTLRKSIPLRSFGIP